MNIGQKQIQNSRPDILNKFPIQDIQFQKSGISTSGLLCDLGLSRCNLPICG
jgi:hypothetical protein